MERTTANSGSSVNGLIADQYLVTEYPGSSEHGGSIFEKFNNLETENDASSFHSRHFTEEEK